MTKSRRDSIQVMFLSAVCLGISQFDHRMCSKRNWLIFIILVEHTISKLTTQDFLYSIHWKILLGNKVHSFLQKKDRIVSYLTYLYLFNLLTCWIAQSLILSTPNLKVKSSCNKPLDLLIQVYCTQLLEQLMGARTMYTIDYYSFVIEYQFTSRVL